jgi:glycosyltransferase involved in cell wall biosynthesis
MSMQFRAEPKSPNAASNRGLRIGVLIVAYNAVTTLAPVLKRIPEEVWNNVEEVVVFDDASRDATYELAVGYQLTTKLEKLRVIKNPSNLGYGGNQKAGYKYFLEKGFDVVVLLHGDGQYAPEILHHLYGPIVRGEAHAVFGSRMLSDYGGPLRGGMPFYKYAGNKILSIFENHALGMSLSEFHSGYRAYDLHALEKISMERMTDDFHFDTEIIIKLNHQGFKIAEVPIPTFYGDEICYVNGLKYARDIVNAVRRYKATVGSNRRYPEFSEYFIEYPLKKSRWSSHTVAQQLVGTNHRILDVGCGDGYVAAALKQNGNDVVGIDIIPAPSRRDALSGYYCADLEKGLPQAVATLPKFEKVLLLDVLQHLHHPETILRQTSSVLGENGRVIVSIPNVANLTIRLKLLFGGFAYSDRGILDRRHLRFFTRTTARDAIEGCGLRVTKVRATVMPVEFPLNLRSDGILARALYATLAAFTKLMPGLFSYQWVFEGVPRTGARL